MRKSKEIFISHIRYGDNGYLRIEENKDANISNYGGVTVAVQQIQSEDESRSMFAVAYSKANTGSPVTKPDNFCRSEGRRWAIKHLEDVTSNQRFTFAIETPIEEIEIKDLIKYAEGLVLNQQIGETQWLFSDTRIRDVMLSSLVVDYPLGEDYAGGDVGPDSEYGGDGLSDE